MIKTTLAEQAYRELRSRIVGGQLAGGQRLLVNELAADLGISPTPVKEACLRLEADGLVTTVPRRGMVVRSLTETDVEQLYAARILIEKGAVEVAFETGRIDDALVRRLTRAVEQHRRYATSSSLDDLAKALTHDRLFHSALVDAAGIPMISETHARIVSQTHTVFVSVPGDYSRSVEEHEDILAAVVARDCAKVVEAMRRHLERSRKNTLHLFSVLAGRQAPASLTA